MKVIHDGHGNLIDNELSLSGVAGQMMLEIRQEIDAFRKTMKSTDVNRMVALTHQYQELKYAAMCDRDQLRARFEAVSAFEPENEMEAIMRDASIDVLKDLGLRFRLTQNN